MPASILGTGEVGAGAGVTSHDLPHRDRPIRGGPNHDGTSTTNRTGGRPL